MELNQMHLTFDTCVERGRTFGHFLVTQLLVDGFKGAPRGRNERRDIPLAAMHPILGEYALGVLNSAFRNITEAPVARAVMPVRIAADDVIFSVGMGITSIVHGDEEMLDMSIRPLFENSFYETLLSDAVLELGNCLNMVVSRNGTPV